MQSVRLLRNSFTCRSYLEASVEEEIVLDVVRAEESLLAVGRDEELLVAVGVALAEVVAAADALQHGAADALCKDFDCNTVT